MERLVSFRIDGDPATTFKRLITPLISNTAKSTDDNPPPIAQHYRDTFKFVDNFNQLLGSIQYDHRVHSAPLVWLIGMIRMAAINTFTLYGDLKHGEVVDKDEEKVKQFIKLLAIDLMKNK